MKFLLLLLFPLLIFADTIPSTSVKSKTLDGNGVTIGSILDALKVNFTNTTLPVTGTFWQATQPVSIAAPVNVVGNFYQATQPVSIASPVPVTGNFLTDTQLRLSPVPISGALTDSQLRASPLTVLTGGLTDAQLRATPINVAVTGAGDATAALQTAGNNTLTAINAKIPSPLSIVSNRLLVDGSGVVQPISGSVTVLNPTTGLTDTQLRASPVPVSGTMAVTSSVLSTLAEQQTQTTKLTSIDSKLTSPLNVTGPLTDTQLRANPIPVSVSFPSGNATLAEQQTQTTKLTSIDSKLTSPLAVTGNFYQATQPVSLAGVSTSAYQASMDATLSAIKSKTDNIDVALSTRTKPADVQLVSGAVTVAGVATESTLSSLNSKVTAVNTGAVVVSSSALPSGGSTSALQSTGNSSLGSIDTKISTLDTSVNTLLKPASTLNAVGSITNTVTIKADTLVNQINAMKVDGSAVTQPVSIASIPIASGAATSALQTSGNASLTSIDSKLTSPLTVTGALTDTQLRATAVPVSLASTTISNFPATQAISASALPLPSGASTAALQTTGNNSLSSIDTKTPALGQALSAASTPVVLPATQITALTPPTTITANIGTTNGLALESGHVASMDATLALIKAKTDNIDVALSTRTKPADTQIVSVSNASIPVTGSFFQATQPISAASLPLPTGGSTSALQTSGNASLTSIDSKLTSPLTITGALTDTQLRASAVPVSVSGVSTSALQTTGNSSLSSIDAKTPALGQALAASSVPVVLTAAQVSTLTPLSTVTANIGTTNGLALESGHAASTDTSTAAINTKIPSGLTVTSTRLLTDGSGVTQPISGSTGRTWTIASSTDSTAAWLKDGLGNSISSTDDGNGGKAIEVAIAATDFIFSSVNSSTTQLAAGATFTGAVETVVNQQSASILLTSDQNGTLVFTEYIDAGGTRVSRSTTVLITASVPYSRSFVINGNYFKAAFTNNGASATTTFNLNTAYGTIPSATALGNGQVSLDEVNGTVFSLGTKTAALSLPVIISQNQSYSAAAANITLAATPTDVFTITGSATKTVRVKSVAASCTQTTSQHRTVLLIKRSTADTAGTSTTMTIVPHDSQNSAGTAVVRAYTANPTLGTTVGNIDSLFLNVQSPTGGVNVLTSGLWQEFPIFRQGSQEVVLRGTSEVLAVNFNSVTSTGGSCNFKALITEE